MEDRPAGVHGELGEFWTMIRALGMVSFPWKMRLYRASSELIFGLRVVIGVSGKLLVSDEKYEGCR